MPACRYQFCCNFVKGSLPWQNLKRPKNRKDEHAHLAQKKQEHAHGLCAGLPSEFAAALKYCSELGFEAEPDYAHLRGLFRRCYLRNSSTGDAFDWKDKRLLGFYDTPQKAAPAEEDATSVEPLESIEPEQLETQRKRSLILNFGSTKRMKSSPSITPLATPSVAVPAVRGTPEEALLHARTLALSSRNSGSRSRSGSNGSSSGNGMAIPSAEVGMPHPSQGVAAASSAVEVVEEVIKEKRELTGTELKVEGELKDCCSSFFS
jgi:hypothetical protein